MSVPGMDAWPRLREVPWLPPALGPGDAPLGVGGSLDAPTLFAAYSQGVFPWFSAGDPVLWWSPDPRAVFEFDRFHVSRRLARTIRSGRFGITVNARFADVMRACGEVREGGTWITPEMIEAYTALHLQGHAHSMEVWLAGELVGGIYGVSVGGLFAGESMFHRVADASKVALAKLLERLQLRGFVLFDTQMVTEHTTSMGAVEIPRPAYLRRLRLAVSMADVTFA